MSTGKPKGILRNKITTTTEDQDKLADIDRQQVIRNTRLNAHLTSESSKGDQIRAKIAEAKAKQSDEDELEHLEHLKWDEINLYKTEQEKSSTMKIDEPKTPYEGGFNPQGEYYREDDEGEENIPDLELGESEYDKEKNSNLVESLYGSEVIKGADYVEEPEEEKKLEETADERHKRFEEMRKAHYHMKGKVLKQELQISDEEEEQ